MPKPDLSTVPPFYHNYIQQVPQDTITAALSFYIEEVNTLLESLPETKWTYRYAENKWSIKEVVQHITDTERIFAYRALCIARKETASLPGFDENAYAAASKGDKRTPQELLEELKAVQQSTLLLFKTFDAEQIAQSGISNNNPISVAAIGFIISGHALHHIRILKERYL